MGWLKNISRAWTNFYRSCVAGLAIFLEAAVLYIPGEVLPNTTWEDWIYAETRRRYVSTSNCSTADINPILESYASGF